MRVDFFVRVEDAGLLAEAAKNCGLSVNQYVKELTECRVADLRNEQLSPEEEVS